MENAFYAIYYTGHAGSGFGLLAFLDGNVVGVDAAGGKFDGSYTVDIDTGILTGNICMHVAAGTWLVTGQLPIRDQPYKVDLPISMSSDLGDGQIIRLDLPIGPLNVRFEKLREFPSAN